MIRAAALLAGMAVVPLLATTRGAIAAKGKTIVVFNARPKMKTRPVIVPAKPAATSKVSGPLDMDDDDDDDDEDDEE